MKSTIVIRQICFLSLAFFVFTGCEKLISFPFSPKEQKPDATKVYVSTVRELYAAVNDSMKRGMLVIIAPGLYKLDSSYPHSGRLELQLDMKLEGQSRQAKQITIDASALPASSFLLPLTSFRAALRTGVIRTGKGSNSIEWLTLIGNTNMSALSVIETDLISTPGTKLRVANCIIQNARMGIDLRNRDVASNNRMIEAEITNNEISGNVLNFGIGIAMQNSRDVRGAIIQAKLSKNYIHGNLVGIAAYNVVTNRSQIYVKSESDRIVGNGLGVTLAAGVNEYPDLLTNDNVIDFEAYGTSILDNKGVPAPEMPRFIPGGINVNGAQLNSTSFPGTINNNTLNLNLWDCQVTGNLEPFQINAFGARSLYTTSTNPAGINNIVNINLHGTSKDVSVNIVPSLPVEPAGTNKVLVYK